MVSQAIAQSAYPMRVRLVGGLADDLRDERRDQIGGVDQVLRGTHGGRRGIGEQGQGQRMAAAERGQAGLLVRRNRESAQAARVLSGRLSGSSRCTVASARQPGSVRQGGDGGSRPTMTTTDSAGSDGRNSDRIQSSSGASRS